MLEAYAPALHSARAILLCGGVVGGPRRRGPWPIMAITAGRLGPLPVGSMRLPPGTIVAPAGVLGYVTSRWT